MGTVKSESDILVADPWPVECRGCGETFMFDPATSYYHECCCTQCVMDWLATNPETKFDAEST